MSSFLKQHICNGSILIPLIVKPLFKENYTCLSNNCVWDMLYICMHTKSIKIIHFIQVLHLKVLYYRSQEFLFKRVMLVLKYYMIYHGIVYLIKTIYHIIIMCKCIVFSNCFIVVTLFINAS